MKPSVPANTHIYSFSFKKPSFIAQCQHTELGSRENSTWFLPPEWQKPGAVKDLLESILFTCFSRRETTCKDFSGVVVLQGAATWLCTAGAGHRGFCRLRRLSDPNFGQSVQRESSGSECPPTFTLQEVGRALVIYSIQVSTHSLMISHRIL